jgi:hypothetical protein
MKTYYGVMEYFEQGVGEISIYYIAPSDSEKEFKKNMINECKIDKHFHIAIDAFDALEPDTPKFIKNNYDLVDKDGYDYVKFETHRNLS